MAYPLPIPPTPDYEEMKEQIAALRAALEEARKNFRELCDERDNWASEHAKKCDELRMTREERDRLREQVEELREAAVEFRTQAGGLAPWHEQMRMANQRLEQALARRPSQSSKDREEKGEPSCECGHSRDPDHYRDPGDEIWECQIEGCICKRYTPARPEGKG